MKSLNGKVSCITFSSVNNAACLDRSLKTIFERARVLCAGGRQSKRAARPCKVLISSSAVFSRVHRAATNNGQSQARAIGASLDLMAFNAIRVFHLSPDC
eukprot:1345736-Pyramimonas_sp.AAC.2